MFRVPGSQIVTTNVFDNSQENNEEKNFMSNSSESRFDDIFTNITKRRKIRHLKKNKSNQLTENLKKSSYVGISNYNLPDKEMNQVVGASYETQLLETSFKNSPTKKTKRRKISTPKVKLINFSSGSNDENSQVEISNNENAQEEEDLEHLNINEHYISTSPGSKLDASLVDPLSVSKDDTLNSQENPKSSSISSPQNKTSETSANDNMGMLGSPIFTGVTKRIKLSPKIKKLNLNVENNRKSPQNKTYNVNETIESLGSPKYISQTQNIEMSETSANENMGSPTFNRITKRIKKLNLNVENNRKSPQNKTYNVNETIESLVSPKYLSQTQNIEMSETSANENMGSPTFNRITKRKKLSPKIKNLNLIVENNRKSPQNKTYNVNETIESLGSPKHLNQTQNIEISETSANKNMEIMGTPTFKRFTKQKKLSPIIKKLNFDVENNKESPSNEAGNLDSSPKHLNQTKTIEMSVTPTNEMLDFPIFAHITKRKKLSPKIKKLNFNVENDEESQQNETGNLNEENESRSPKHINQTQNIEMSETSANENMEIMGSPTFNRTTKQKKFSPKIKKINLDVENNEKSPQNKTYNVNKTIESFGSPKHLNQTQYSETSANENMEIMGSPTFNQTPKGKKFSPKIKKINLNVENNEKSPQNKTYNVNETIESFGSPKHLNQTQYSETSANENMEIMGSPTFNQTPKGKKFSPKIKKINLNVENNEKTPQNKTYNVNETIESFGSPKHLNQTQNIEMSETSGNESMEIMGSPTFNRITKRKIFSPKVKKNNLDVENNEKSPPNETGNLDEENESLGSPKHLNQTQNIVMPGTSADEGMEIMGSPTFNRTTKRKKLNPKIKKLNLTVENTKDSTQSKTDNLNEENESLGSQKRLSQTQNIEMSETSANESMKIMGSPTFIRTIKRKKLNPKIKKLNLNVENTKESTQSETDNLNEENESLGSQKRLRTQNIEMSETSANESMEIMGSPTFNQTIKRKKLNPKIKKLNLNVENNKESTQSETDNLNEENESLGSQKRSSQTQNIEMSETSANESMKIVGSPTFNRITKQNEKGNLKSDSSLKSSCNGLFTQKEKTIDFSREENELQEQRKMRISPRLKKSSQYTDNSESTGEEKNLFSEIFDESPSEYEFDNEYSSDGYTPSKTHKKKVKIKQKSNSIMHQSTSSNSEAKASSSSNLGKKDGLKIKKLNSSLTEQTGEKLDNTLLTYENFGTGQATSSPTLEEKESKKVQKSSLTKLMKKIVNKKEDLSSTWNSTLQADDCFEESRQQIQPRQNKKQVIGMKSFMKMAGTDTDLYNEEFIDQWLSHSQLTAKLPIEVKKELYNFLKMDSTLLNKLKNLDIKVDWELPTLHQMGDGFSSKRYTKLGPQTEILNGVFSEEENNKIMSNWKKFCKIYGFDKYDFRPFVGAFHPSLSPLNQIQMKNFVAFLAQGLNLRHLYSVYYRFTTITKYYKRGRFSKTEDDILLYCNNNVPSKFVCSLCSVLLHRHRSVLNKRLKKLLERNMQESLYISQNEENENVDWEKIGFEIFQTTKVTTKNRNIVDHNVITQVASKTNTSVIKVAKAFHLKIQPTWNCSKIIYKDYFRIRLIKKILKYKYKEWGKIDWNKLNKKMYNLGPVFLYSEFRKTITEHVPASMHYRLKLCLDKLESKLPKLEEMATEDHCLKISNFDTQEQEVNIEDE